MRGWVASLMLIAAACAKAPPAPAPTQTPTANAHRGRHVDHRFDDAEEWAKRFESQKRDGWQNPDYVIDGLE